MENNSILFFVAVGVVVIVASIAVYHVMRYLRGSIKLFLSRTAFSAGESITGYFDLVTKKAIQGNQLLVTLIGTQVTRQYHNGRTVRRSQEIYRDERIIEQSRSYPAGYSARYDFDMTAPQVGPQNAEASSPMGRALVTALRAMNHTQDYFEWKLEARLDAEGVDLANAKRVSINMTNTGS